MTLATGIIADIPTNNLNIYPRAVLDDILSGSITEPTKFEYWAES